MTFHPTPEQEHVLDCFATGEDLAVEACAGSGKTSTMLWLAEYGTDQKLDGHYFAFNKSIVEETREKADKRKIRLKVSTIHSAAMGAYGWQFRDRLGSTQRMRSAEIASILGVKALTVNVHGTAKYLSAGYLASLCVRGLRNFCQSGDPEPTGRHIPYIEGIDMPSAKGRTYANNNLVRDHLAQALYRAWGDAFDPAGRLPYDHAYYLKGWELSKPRIDADYVLIDEAQDISGVMMSILLQQECQKIWCGDSNQEIYAWAGAHNALDAVVETGTKRAELSHSFRFGPEIAEVANYVLSRIPGNRMVITGAGGPGNVGPVEAPSATLTRTNARAVETYLGALDLGRKPHILGGGLEAVRFAQAAQDLEAKGFTSHPELGCFKSWVEVCEYVAEDPQGGELALLVKLVNTYGAAKLVSKLQHMPPEKSADVVISTAHKCKGRGFASVRLASDFPTGKEIPLGSEELRLAYVAVSRAEQALDITATPHLSPRHSQALLVSEDNIS